MNDSYGFKDAYLYYRFAEDEDSFAAVGGGGGSGGVDSSGNVSGLGRARLAASCAGNGAVGVGVFKYIFNKFLNPKLNIKDKNL